MLPGLSISTAGTVRGSARTVIVLGQAAGLCSVSSLGPIKITPFRRLFVYGRRDVRRLMANFQLADKWIMSVPLLQLLSP
jgi:hypothetical protein